MHKNQEDELFENIVGNVLAYTPLGWCMELHGATKKET